MKNEKLFERLLESLKSVNKSTDEIVKDRIELFNKIYQDFEGHLNPIQVETLKYIITELGRDYCVEKYATRFVLERLKETSFCSYNSYTSIFNEFYIRNVVDVFNSISYQGMLYEQTSDESRIRCILKTLLFLQDYEFTISKYSYDKGGLYNCYTRFMGEDYYQSAKVDFEDDYMRMYLRQFDL